MGYCAAMPSLPGPTPDHRPTLPPDAPRLLSPPPPVSSIHVERSRSNASGGTSGSGGAEEIRKIKSSRRISAGSMSYGGSYGRKRGGGFLLGMNDYVADVSSTRVPLEFLGPFLIGRSL